MKISLKLKMVIIFFVLLLISCLLISVTVYKSSMDFVKESVGKQASNIVEKATTVIDIERYKELNIASNENGYYSELREELNKIRELNQMVYLYTMTRVQNGNDYDYYYMVDGQPLGSEDASELGEKEESAETFPALKRAFKTGNVEYEISNEPDYGPLISVYVPIKTEAGDIIGIMGADLDASQVYDGMAANEITLIIITISVLVVGLLIIYFLTDYFTRPLRKLTEQVELVGKGDLSVEIETNRQDEIGTLTRAFQQMVDDLKGVIDGINTNSIQLINTSNQLLDNSEKVSEASHQISTSIQEVSESVYTQYKSSEESATTLEHMSNGIQKIASASANVFDLSSTSLDYANSGKNQIENVINQMNIINQSVSDSSSAIKKLEEQSEDISSIIKMIRDISAQTNLLALNAAIEAARAGESGKGFAVVADEVRKLAEQSEQSTNSIAALIEKMNENTSRTVETMNVVTRNVEEGIQVVEEAGNSFENIVESIHSVSSHIKEVSQTSEEMSAFSEEVAAAVEETTVSASQAADNTKRVVSRTVEQESHISDISTAITNLTKMAKNLDELIKKFVLK
ncbi:methyl-accepting chemotaxis protein [Lederbergia wuyishanensis]|uniref:Methyl-accepting chemotaxis protein n=1 Tax=Lederbergia wuyishanensis TaxID=1347903 RepID=A0ABU0D6C2_9BACI|nr:methyl-accepting chemotaxis protein [Lederbergia wuyishanensis]MCJ8008639.1 methyl-accepting chemotaxis protein [Lederbergia wuyishanensis]MDQ0343944.1 methyl-accepting chemotaxis protein [Lederbergia wuyishanensis]